MSDLDFDSETAALEGYLFVEAERLLGLASRKLADDPDVELLNDMKAWRRGLTQVRERWARS